MSVSLAWPTGDAKIAPSLQQKQRQLKKARLQDSLSDHLINRPGPLELVKGNILQADPSLLQAVQGLHASCMVEESISDCMVKH